MIAVQSIQAGLVQHLGGCLGDLHVTDFPKDGQPQLKTAGGSVYVRFESLQAGVYEGIQYTDTIYVYALIVAAKDLVSEKGALAIVERVVNAVAWAAVPISIGVVRPQLSSIDLIASEDGVWQYQINVNIQAPVGPPRA